MSRKTPTTTQPRVDIARVTWIATFVLPLVLAALLCAAKSAQAATIEGPLDPAPGLEGEIEGEFDEEGCEEVEEGFYECEPEDEAEEGPFPPEECLLQTARARVLAYASRNKLRLMVRYTALEPTKVYVDFSLKGGKGSVDLGPVKRRFSKHGVLTVDEKLSESRMDQVRSAKRFLVTLDVPEAPNYCQRYYSRRLTIKKTSPNQDVWVQSDSVFGT